jgi:hypothetical protein
MLIYTICKRGTIKAINIPKLPLHDSQKLMSSYISRILSMVYASLFPMMSPFQLQYKYITMKPLKYK